MAQVKQKSGPLSESLKKKSLSFNNNGVTSSFKHLYDDIFGSSSSSNVNTSNAFMEDDYAEIFGSSNSNNGSWSIPYSSVPIIELPRDDNGGCFKGESVDYYEVFGGVDNGGAFGLVDCEEFFDQIRKKTKTSPSCNLHRNQGRTTESSSSETPSPFYDEQSLTNGFRRSFDNVKQLEPGNDKETVGFTSKPRKVAHVCVYSFHEAVIKDDLPDTEPSIWGKQEKHYRHMSLDLGDQSSDGTGLQKACDLSVTNAVDSMNGSVPPIKSTTKVCPSFDNTKHTEYEVNGRSINGTNGKTLTPDVHPTHESNDSLNELAPTQDVQRIHKNNQSLRVQGPTQEALSSRTFAISNEPQPTNDVNMVKEQKKHSHNTSLDLGSKLNDNYNILFQTPCGLTESILFGNSHESSEASSAAGPLNVVEDDLSFDHSKVKKKGRHSRMASVDLGDYKHFSEHDVGLKRKPRLGSSYSFDASHDPAAAGVKVQPSMMQPPSTVPRFLPAESLYKLFEDSSDKCSQTNWAEGAGDSTPSLAEDLDVDSDAATSVAVLQRAIEEAKLCIHLAKAFLERGGQGSTKVRFKDTLKMRVAKKNGVVNEETEAKQTKMHKCCPPAIDSELKKSSSPVERKQAVEVSQRVMVFEDKKFVKNGKLAYGEDAKVSNLISGVYKREGEWEAAKHLNQLINGVKNKLSSFMPWQSETEKKAAANEMEANMKPHKHPEEIKHDLKDHETCKRTQTWNEVTSTSAGEAMYEESELQISSNTVETEDNGVVSSFNVEQNIVGNKVETIPHMVAPSSTNVQFFAFRGQKVCDSDTKVAEREPLETRNSEIVNGQEQVIDVVEIEYTLSEFGEGSREDSDDKFTTQDNKREDNMSRTGEIYIRDAENDKTVEDPFFLDVRNGNDLSVEEVWRGDVIWKDDLCSICGENVDMVEEHFCMDGNNQNEPAYEEEEQDYKSGKNHLGSVNEANDGIVEQPHSFAGHEEKGLRRGERTLDDMYNYTHTDCSNEENEMMVKELCTQEGHGRKVVSHKENNNRSSKYEDELIDNYNHCRKTSERIDEYSVGEILGETENHSENVKLQKETWKNNKFTKCDNEGLENNRDQRETNYIEEIPAKTYECESIEHVENQTDLIEEIAENVNVEASCVASADEGSKQHENVSSSKGEEACNNDVKSHTTQVHIQSPVSAQKASELSGEESTLSTQKSSDFNGEEHPESTQKLSKLIGGKPVVSSSSTEREMELDKNEINEGLNGTIGTLQHENVEFDLSSGLKDFDVQAGNLEYLYKFDKQTYYLEEAGENLHVGEFVTVSVLDRERSDVQRFHRRRRWSDNGGAVVTPERPNILEGRRVDLEIDQRVLDESELAGSMEIHADKLDSSAAEVTTARDADASSSHDNVRTNVETTPTRRKWFVKGGKPEPVSLFEDIKVNLKVPLESMNESLLHISGNCLYELNANSGEFHLMKSGVGVEINGDNGMQSVEEAPRRKRWFECGESVGPNKQVKINDDIELTVEVKVDEDNLGKYDGMSIPQKKNDVREEVEPQKACHRDHEVVNRGKEKEKETIAVEREICEARERAFADAKERARRDPSDRPNVEARPKVAAGLQEKGNMFSESISSSDKASVEAKLKAERTAVDRLAAEARERALQKALSEKASHGSREQAGRSSLERDFSLDPKNKSSRDSESSNNNEKFEGTNTESTQMHKARLERQTRTMEQAAKALEEKNRRDILAQKEQTAKNMMADSLDAEVKRWCTGKEGHLRALLSTLQYVLSPDSGWQPISLTDLVESTAVRKAYKKATLCVHPDKLQQRGATIQQKYICEKVFDLLQDAWNNFILDEG